MARAQPPRQTHVTLPWVCAFYALLAILLTWPLARNLTTHVPGDGIDDPSLAWNLWWIKERLVDQVNFDIFHVDWIFQPVQINLGFYTLTPLNGLLSMPMQSALTLVVANNLLLLASFVLGALGMYLLALQELVHYVGGSNQQRQHGGSQPVSTTATSLHGAAILAGLIYAFASSKLFYVALGQFNIASSQWIPFCVLYLLRLARSKNWHSAGRSALFAALFLTLQAWAELTYASFLIIFSLLVFFWSLLTSPLRPRWVGLRLASFVLLALLFLVGVAPFLWAMIPDLLREGDFFASGGGFADTYSADLFGYLLPTQLHPFWGHWVERFTFPHDKGQQIFIGYSAMLLAALGIAAVLRRESSQSQRRWPRFWFFCGFFFWWLTLGAEVRWLGNGSGIPGPFALISQLPFFSGNRYPSRYSVMLMLAVAQLAAFGLLYLWQQRHFRTHGRLLLIPAALLFGTLFLFEHLALPLPLSDFRVPTLYERLARQEDDFTLLELPTGWRNGARVMGKSDILIMMQQWYQTTHGKRRLGGNTSRNPPHKFQYYVNAPLLGDLIALMNATPGEGQHQDEIARLLEQSFPELVARNQPIAAAVLDFLDITHVTLHVEKASPLLRRFVDAALPLTPVERWEGSDWRGAPATIELYRVIPPSAASQTTIDFSDRLSPLYLGAGWAPQPWQGVRYATRPCATLLLDLPPAARVLTLTVAAEVESLRATVNGQRVATVHSPTAAAADEVEFVLTLPTDVATAPVDQLVLCMGPSLPLAAVAPAPTPAGWPVGATGATLPVSLLVQSAGNDVGNNAQIWRAGLPLLAAQTGYNLAALDGTGTTLATAHFDTFASAAAADALAQWLQQWPRGTIIAGAVKDEASNSLNARAVTALAALGVATDLRDRFRWGHAFVGMVGAAEGTALERAELLQPASVALGAPFDAPAVYGGVRQIRYEP